MSKDPLDLFGERIVKPRTVCPWRTGAQAKAKKYLKLKDNKVLALTILILIAGCFFYIQNCSFGVKAKANREIGSFNTFGYHSRLDRESRIKLPVSEITLDSLPRRQAGHLHRNGIRDGDNIKISIEKQNIADLNSIFCLNPQNKSPETMEIEKELYAMVQNYPIKEMIPYIAEYDRKVAALIIGIAKKESNWGKRAPSKNGEVCYNYWGYKGAGSLGLAMGYGCFASPQEGVEIVGGRINELVDKDLDTPRKMVVWKCGSSCNGHNPAGVRKWISDVNIYFNKLTT